MHEQIEVNLGDRAYPVHVGAGLLGSVGRLTRERGLQQRAAFVITNADVAPHYLPVLTETLTASGFEQVVSHEIEASEQGKNWDEFSRACAALLSAFPDSARQPLVFLLGGGVVGDLGGFAAAVFRRGVPFVQIPTTLLAAVDSSVGGKVAVNFGGIKNIMGAFSQPSMVCCDLATLRTLPQRQIRSGLAEVIKYGAVCDAGLFLTLESGGVERILARDPATLQSVISQCVRLKAAVVEQDEFDRKGIRNVLNFGHTIGHALELSAEYALTHGEAIAIGMDAASGLAVRMGLVEPSFQTRLAELLRRAGLPLKHPGDEALFAKVVKALQLDKKFRNGRNLFVLPTGIGLWRPVEDIPWDHIHGEIRRILAMEKPPVNLLEKSVAPVGLQ
jgi:3-dehydroquinate synthase